MTYKATAIASMLNGDPSGRLRQLHDQLIAIGLKSKISPNTDTLVFEAINREKKRVAIAALRTGNSDIYSFPRTYWIRHTEDVRAALDSLHARHFIDTEGFVSTSQHSLRQVRVSEDTFTLLSSIIAGLVARHATEIAGNV